ncbi:MAG: hypothetical protein JOY62_11490 [Acidobacteriaceae bacterium]|nr:hypothetical protein [Acidobacteriaceae bacterium]MBV9780583.1 hypothetical protein [Acidobacteriaceae bacterium]
MRRSIKEKIEQARLRAATRVRPPYIIEPTGRGRTKCHADAPDPNCRRCRRRLLMRRLRNQRRETQPGKN